MLTVQRLIRCYFCRSYLKNKVRRLNYCMLKLPAMALFFSMSMSSLSRAFSWQAVKCDKITISKDNAVENQNLSPSPAWSRTGAPKVF